MIVAQHPFEGTLRQAVLAAGQTNSKAKLEMSYEERLDYAWRLVRMDGFNKPQIAGAAAVAERTVQYMKRVREILGEEAFKIDSWWRARHKAKGGGDKDMTDQEREDWVDAQAQKHADKIAKACGTKLAENLEIAQRALAIYFGSRYEHLARTLAGSLSTYEEELEGDF